MSEALEDEMRYKKISLIECSPPGQHFNSPAVIILTLCIYDVFAVL